jgi:hypothetical protein
MLQCRFLTIRILWNLSPKSRKRHFRESRFKNFLDEQALDPLENLCIYGARLVPLALLLGGPSKMLNWGPSDITLRHCCTWETQGPAPSGADSIFIEWCARVSSFRVFPRNLVFGVRNKIAWENSKVLITTNNRYGQRLCLEAWHINMSRHALNRDDGAYLPEEYMHLIGRWRHPLGI